MSEDSPDQHRRRIVQFAGLTVGGALAGAPSVASASESDGDGRGGGEGANGDDCLFDGPGLATVESDRDFDATVGAITERIESGPLTLLATVDHAANAESAGLDLPPTTLLIFGNPEVGTQLMQANRSVGVDLPQKMLVWCDERAVNVTYNDPEYLAARHGIEGEDELLNRISTALRNLATGGDGDETDG